MLFASQTEQDRYWAAECVLEVYFYTFNELKSWDRIHQHLDQVWYPIQRFLTASELREEEETLWAKIAILQTFCEGALSVCFEKEQLHGEDDWSFAKIMPVLRTLVTQAILRDESGEWSRSRGFIRQQLIELDQDVMADQAYMNNALCFERYETLLGLWKIADKNNDRIMVSSIQGKFWLLSHMQEPQTRGLGISFVPYQVDARLAYPTQQTVGPSHGNIKQGHDNFAAASRQPRRFDAPPDSALSSRSLYPSQDQQAKRDRESFLSSNPRARASAQVSRNDAFELARSSELTQKKISKQPNPSKWWQEMRY
jgi:hypothetical protein